MSIEEFEDYVDVSITNLFEKQRALEEEFNIHLVKEYKLVAESSTLLLDLSNGEKLKCRVQVIGSLFGLADTWCWSWVDEEIEEPLKHDTYRIVKFGKKESIEEITEEQWPADEENAWAMTALSSEILNAKGAISIDNDRPAGGSLYLTIKDIQKI